MPSTPEQEEARYRRILAEDPACHEALNGLGVVMHRRGRRDIAASLIRRALAIKPGAADYHFNLAEVLRESGRPGDAVLHFREAIARGEYQADYFFGLGNALSDRGEHEQAAGAFRIASRLAPYDAEIRNNLGNALARLGVLDEAEEVLRAAVDLDDGYGEAQHNLAMVLREAGRSEQALDHARFACERLKGQPEPLLTLGQLLDESGNPSAAIACYLQASRVTGENPDLLASIADGLSTAGDTRSALAAYRRAARLRPRSAGCRIAICRCLVQQHRFDEAETECRALIDKDPDCAPALGTLAVCLQVRGEFQTAAGLLWRALQLKPDLTEAAYLLAADGDAEIDDEALARWLTLERDSVLAPEKQCHLQFAIARVYERRREYDVAFGYYRSANEIKAGLYPFDARRHAQYVERVMTVFSRDFFEQNQSSGLGDERPVFIVGMPRSGSTLVEQVLAGHAEITAAGENPEMLEIVRGLPSLPGVAGPAPECCRELSPAVLADLARRYLDSLPSSSRQAVRVTDKMLGNFLRLGLIALLFPKSRVIHCMRDPLDTCISCYTQDFAQGLRFTTDMANLASFYRCYTALMEHWRRVLPLPILDVRYEELVEDPDRQSRRLMEFCNLPWEGGVASPDLQKREIHTASVWQARQPVHKDSIQRWRHYEEHIGALLEALQRPEDDAPGP